MSPELDDLTLDKIRHQVEEILEADQTGSDPEQTHWMQDQLYMVVLHAAATGHPDAQDMAREAFRIKDAGSERWYG